MAEERRALHSYLSISAYDAWAQFSDGNGVSLTGLLEALGLQLLGELGETGADDLRQEWVRAGRRIDADRRRRDGRRK
jgi:hypothetical protein